MTHQRRLRNTLIRLLGGGKSHVPFEKAVAGFPFRLMGKRPRGLPYSPWQILEHIRITQWDILGYTVNPNHVSPKWPEEYWPTNPAPPSLAAWKQSVRSYQADLRRFCNLIRNPKRDPLAPLPHDKGVTIFHMALLLADHTAYHLGQLIVLRRLFGAWPA